MVKVSAQLSVNSEGGAGLGAGGCEGMAAFLRELGAVEGAFLDMQHPPSFPPPPQQPPPDGVPLADREAANVLQKRVLRGSA